MSFLRPDPQQYWLLWFKGVHFEEIGGGNVKEWLAWGFFNKASWEAEDNDELKEYITELENSLGRRFVSGRKAATPMRPTLDDVNISHKSLLYYILPVATTEPFCQHTFPLAPHLLLLQAAHI
ncbi:MAG: hypothetical protein Q9164_003843 [Protoblastenia rupestris]